MMKVKDLIEILEKTDPEYPIVTVDCCYGRTLHPSAVVFEVEKFQDTEFAELDMEPGDRYVLLS